MVQQIRNQLILIGNMKTNYAKQKETAAYWLEQLTEEERKLKSFLFQLQEQAKTKNEAAQPNKTNPGSPLTPTSIKEQMREHKLEILLNELFKTLESK